MFRRSTSPTETPVTAAGPSPRHFSHAPDPCPLPCHRPRREPEHPCRFSHPNVGKVLNIHGAAAVPRALNSYATINSAELLDVGQHKYYGVSAGRCRRASLDETGPGPP